MPTGRWWLVAYGLALGLLACTGPSPPADEAVPSASTPVTTRAPEPTTSLGTTGSVVALPPTTTADGTTAPSPSSTTGGPEPTSTSTPVGDEGPGPTPVSEPGPIRLRLDRRVGDAATEGFAPFVESVLTDARGWERAGFAFTFSDTDFDYSVVLAEGPEVDALCLPYDTFGRFSCQIGPVVALNADRWRTAVESWPGSLDEYRTMLVNHEVGHLLGQHHPADRCPGTGQPAPVMAQQSSGVAPCTANPWPLPWEITCAGLGLEPLAPPFERGIVLTCGPDGPLG